MTRNPLYEYQLSWNLINAYQELNSFIFKCVVSHIIMYFSSPLWEQASWLYGASEQKVGVDGLL